MALTTKLRNAIGNKRHVNILSERVENAVSHNENNEIEIPITKQQHDSIQPLILGCLVLQFDINMNN